MNEYYVRKMPGDGWWEVAKFSGGKEPNWIYDVHDRYGCNCQGCKSHGHCKHRDLVDIHRDVPACNIRTYWYERNKWAWYETIIRGGLLAIPQRRAKGGRLLPTGRQGTYAKKAAIHKKGRKG